MKTFNININSSTPANFQVVFGKLPFETTFIASKELELNIVSTIIPGMTLSPTELNWQGGTVKYSSGDFKFNPWNIEFSICDDFNRWFILYNWITHIHNNSTIYGSGNWKDYSTNASILMFNNYHRPVIEVIFQNIFPLSLSDLPLNYGQGANGVNCTVEFAYDRYEIRNKHF